MEYKETNRIELKTTNPHSKSEVMVRDKLLSPSLSGSRVAVSYTVDNVVEQVVTRSLLPQKHVTLAPKIGCYSCPDSGARVTRFFFLSFFKFIKKWDKLLKK